MQNKIKELYENKINHIVENEINKKLPKEVSKQVSKKTGEEIEYIEKTAKECKREQTLMKEKNILVISNDNEEEKLLKDSNLLNQFEKAEMVVLGNEIDNLGEYDVILLMILMAILKMVK